MYYWDTFRAFLLKPESHFMIIFAIALLFGIGIMGLAYQKIQYLNDRHSLVLQARTWPVVDAVVVDSGYDIEPRGFGDNQRTLRKKWARVKYCANGAEYEAKVLDAHCPGHPGELSLQYEDYGDRDFGERLIDAAKSVSHPYPIGGTLMVNYDPSHSGQCMLKAEASFQYYASLLFNWIGLIVGLIIVIAAVWARVFIFK